jgi:hypothetical protein
LLALGLVAFQTSAAGMSAIRRRTRQGSDHFQY